MNSDNRKNVDRSPSKPNQAPNPTVMYPNANNAQTIQNPGLIACELLNKTLIK